MTNRVETAPLEREATDAAGCCDLRPTLRGWSHTLAFIIAIPAGVLLIRVADGAMAIAAASIYAATLLLGFGTSAAYHRLARTETARQVMQRLDHSMIYVLIAGTYVPASLLGLPLRWGIPLLSVVACGASLGIVLKLVAFDKPRAHLAGQLLYPVLGWSALAVAPTLVDSVPRLTLALILGGGLLYTIGFPVLILRRPDPIPAVFGYHEVWHLFTIGAAILHFVAVARLVA